MKKIITRTVSVTFLLLVFILLTIGCSDDSSDKDGTARDVSASETLLQRDAKIYSA